MANESKRLLLFSRLMKFIQAGAVLYIKTATGGDPAAQKRAMALEPEKAKLVSDLRVMNKALDDSEKGGASLETMLDGPDERSMLVGLVESSEAKDRLTGTRTTWARKSQLHVSNMWV